MIKFPKMHIAESVVNRILNVADGIPAQASQAVQNPPPPIVPETAQQGAMLDAQLATPPTDALPGLDQAPDAGATVAGKPLLDTLLEPKT